MEPKDSLLYLQQLGNCSGFKSDEYNLHLPILFYDSF